MLQIIFRYYNTIKYLTFKQVFYRLKYILLPLRKIHESTQSTDVRLWSWNAPNTGSQKILNFNQVIFLNEKGYVNKPEDWNNSNKSKLWLYNLHYFDDLVSHNSSQRYKWQLHLINAWIDNNPPLTGNGWEPYTISLRVVNWIKWCNTNKLIDEKIISSLLVQAKALEKQLEYHILGNHLFANAKALIFLGSYIKGEIGQNYLNKGLNILKDEIDEQFLLDGGHFERSPMYHSILLWDVLDLVNLSLTTENLIPKKHYEKWVEVSKSAIEWLRTMTHPDNEIAFFNDSTFGIAPTPSEIYKYAKKLKINPLPSVSPLRSLLQSGFSKIQYPNYTVIFDHGDLGPDYLLGHGHADTLSIELSIGIERLFVNSGISIYGSSEERIRQRKTSSHNTVEVNGLDSSEVWSGFRVARRAKAQVISMKYGKEICISAKHNGYHRLRHKVTHKRVLRCSENTITIKDSLSGNKTEGIAFLHIHPNFKLIESIDNKIELISSSSGERVMLNSSELMNIEDSTWHPEFGKSIQTKRIAIQFNNGALSIKVNLINK